jgi:hypothetical protein
MKNNNAAAAIHTRPNRLMGFELDPLSEDNAILTIAPEFGESGSVVINRRIAEALRAKLDAFLNPLAQSSN